MVLPPMMVSQQHGFVFVSVPKCATNTLYTLFRRKFGGALLGGRFHGRNVPAEYSALFSFTVVRNPFSRAVSIWHSTTQRGHDRYQVRKSMGQRANDFEQFTLWLCGDHSRPVFLPFHRWLGERRFQYVMRTERLLADVNQLPFVRSPLGQLDRENASLHQRRPWQEYYTPRAVRHVQQWAGDDMERYGYEAHPH